MSLRDILKSRLQIATKRYLRPLVAGLIDEGNEEEELSPGHERGHLNYTFAGQFIEGTDLRSMLAGSAAFTSIWVKNDPELDHLKGELLLPGPYQVTVKMDVVFEPYDVEAAEKELDELDDLVENGLPVYEAAELIKALGISDKDPK